MTHLSRSTCLARAGFADFPPEQALMPGIPGTTNELSVIGIFDASTGTVYPPPRIVNPKMISSHVPPQRGPEWRVPPVSRQRKHERSLSERNFHGHMHSLAPSGMSIAHFVDPAGTPTGRIGRSPDQGTLGKGSQRGRERKGLALRAPWPRSPTRGAAGICSLSRLTHKLQTSRFNRFSSMPLDLLAPQDNLLPARRPDPHEPFTRCQAPPTPAAPRLTGVTVVFPGASAILKPTGGI